VISVDPALGDTIGATTVTLTGTLFAVGAEVSLGGSACTSVVVDSETQITCTTPAHAAGAVDVIVTNPDNESGMLSGAYTYAILSFQAVKAVGFGGTGSDGVSTFDIDPQGQAVVMGNFSGTVDFGCGALTSTASANAYLVKKDFDTNQCIWSRLMPNGRQSTAIDGAGDVLVAGSFSSAFDFGDGVRSTNGGNDIYLAKYAGADGTPLWVRTFGSASTFEWASVAVDQSNDDVVITGTLGGSINFGGGPLSLFGSTDIFLAKFSSNGTHAWSRSFGGNGPDEQTAMALSSLGEIGITGMCRNASNFGGGALPNVNQKTIFIAKYSGVDGSYIWARRTGGTNSAWESWGAAVDFDAAGNLYGSGYFSGTINFGTGPNLVATSTVNTYVVKLDSSDGSHLWSQRFGNTNEGTYGAQISVDQRGNVYLWDGQTGDMAYSTFNFTGQGQRDLYLVKLLVGDGSVVWARQFANALPQYQSRIKAFSDGRILVGLSYQGDLSFGEVSLSSAGDQDGGMVKFVDP